MNIMKAVVNKVIDTTFPFIKWIGKIIKISVIMIALIVIIAIIFKLGIFYYVNHEKQQRKK